VSWLIFSGAFGYVDVDVGVDIDVDVDVDVNVDVDVDVDVVVGVVGVVVVLLVMILLREEEEEDGEEEEDEVSFVSSPAAVEVGVLVVRGGGEDWSSSSPCAEAIADYTSYEVSSRPLNSHSGMSLHDDVNKAKQDILARQLPFVDEVTSEQYEEAQEKIWRPIIVVSTTRELSKAERDSLPESIYGIRIILEIPEEVTDIPPEVQEALRLEKEED